MKAYEIEVPGTFRKGIAFLDLETVKVPAPEGFRMQNGELLKQRWSIALAGVARDGIITIVDFEAPEGQERMARFLSNERDGLARLGLELKHASGVVYSATREFDEMICRGRFTNARRAHLPVPTLPAVPGAEELSWFNIGTQLRRLGGLWRSEDIPSREVPQGLFDGRRTAVLVHLLRDVVELIVMVGAPSFGCQAWCTGILVDYQAACDALEI
jgi:hypothetical protein